MRLAFAFYKYFPFSGLAKSFVNIANICVQKGYTVDVYVVDWQGDKLPGYNVHELPSKGMTNHSKVSDFHRKLTAKLEHESYDLVVGFNKIPGVDIYHASDTCYIDRFEHSSFLHKLNPRYRFYSSVERSVFGVDSKTVCLMISDVQMDLFKKHYKTPDERLVMLPPGIVMNRKRPPSIEDERSKFRQLHQLANNDTVLLMVGSGFKTKGVDRGIAALASLPADILNKTHLMVVGQDRIPTYQRISKELGVSDRVHFMGGRDDVPDFLLGADLLLHPARKENTGNVILEAMILGLPMLVSSVCGYAKHVIKSKAGVVSQAPFKQEIFNEELTTMLKTDKEEWVSNALLYASTEDLYSKPQKAVEVIERIAARKSNAI